jgi:hypothetical protein
MGIGNNRDYKTSDRAVRNSLAAYDARVLALITGGLPVEVARKQAYQEIIDSRKSRREDREFAKAFTPNKHGEYA